MCFAHVAQIWVLKADNKFLLKDQENLPKVKRDLSWLNTSIHHADLAPIAVELMLSKWRTVYGEETFAAKFSSSWQGRRFTRAEANEGGSGGVPSDNNMLESKNRVIKAELRREKPAATALVPRMVEWIETQAKCDIGFNTEHSDQRHSPASGDERQG